MKLFFLLTLVLLMGCSLRQQNNFHDEDYPNRAMVPFVKVDSLNPILSAGSGVFDCPIVKDLVRWEEKDVFNPAAAVRNDSVYLIYRAEDTIGKHAGTSRLGLAVSGDGLHFKRRHTPILFPAEDFMKGYEWEGGIEDSRIVEREDGLYIMTYTAYDGKTARLCVASSRDLVTWTKHGLALAGSYQDTWSKSGAIVAKEVGSKIIAQKINEKYWMYFGDTDLFMATSDDLIRWEPLIQNSKLKSILRARRGYFDSRLVESGPYALLTEKGIVLIYNGMNLDEGGDPSIAKGAYCAGQALFDSQDPTRLVDRLEKISYGQIGHTRLPGKSIRFVLRKALFSFAEGGFCTLVRLIQKLPWPHLLFREPIEKHTYSRPNASWFVLLVGEKECKHLLVIAVISPQILSFHHSIGGSFATQVPVSKFVKHGASPND